jgi:hypothetical protein
LVTAQPAAGTDARATKAAQVERRGTKRMGFSLSAGRAPASGAALFARGRLVISARHDPRTQEKVAATRKKSRALHLTQEHIRPHRWHAGVENETTSSAPARTRRPGR